MCESAHTRIHSRNYFTNGTHSHRTTSPGISDVGGVVFLIGLSWPSCSCAQYCALYPMTRPHCTPDTYGDACTGYCRPTRLGPHGAPLRNFLLSSLSHVSWLSSLAVAASLLVIAALELQEPSVSSPSQARSRTSDFPPLVLDWCLSAALRLHVECGGPGRL